MLSLSAVFFLTSQWIILKITGVEFNPVLEMALSGTAIFGSAFLLSWSAELAQLEIPQSLAIASVAFLAVLPEYAVDAYFAWNAGKDIAYAPYAVANMTGANRLLIGVGWATVIFCAWFKSGKPFIRLEAARKTEIRFLAFATAYSFLIPIKGNISLFDSFFLLVIFVFYLKSVAKSEFAAPKIQEGPTEIIAKLPRARRNAVVALMFMLGGISIFLAAEPFAESMLETAQGFGIEKFLLVQWLAPLASEAPEFIVAIIFVLKGSAGAGIGTLISSSVNQWTLLVGMIPVAFGIAGLTTAGFPLDQRQVSELWLTTAQSIFALAVLANLSFSVWEALMLFALFAAQFLFPEIRGVWIVAYLSLTVLLLIFFRDNRNAFLGLFKKRPKN